MTKFKPLLACEADLEKLRYPLLASPKLDGIRCIIHPELGPVTRNLKPIANVALRERLSKLPPYLDGELIAGDPTAKDCMQQTTSAVMSSGNDSSHVKYYVFDSFSDQSRRAEDRHSEALGRAMMGPKGLTVPLFNEFIETQEGLLAYEEDCVDAGYEGIMLRDPQGRYKFGRSTVKEGILLKVKRFADMEGTVVGFVERMHNGNEATKDALGRTKRSSSKEGKVGRGDLGALVLVIAWNGVETRVEVGSGFTDEQRAEIYANRKAYELRSVTFKYQPSGSKDAPRFPVFKCFREDV